MLYLQFSDFFRVTLKNKLFIAALLLIMLFAHSNRSEAKQVMIFGDSLSAAYGLDIDQGWVHLLAEHLNEQYGEQHTIVNASISGETTVGGLARLPLSLEQIKPDVVILELGANDGLRGYPLDGIRNNLDKMISLIQDSNAKVILAGISLPPNYNPRYVDKFSALFSELAEKKGLPFINFYREEFLNKPGYIQQDGLHPTAITQPIFRDIMIEFFQQHKILD